MTDALNSNMAYPGRLIPPPELAPGPPVGATREQCIAMWFDLVEATDQIFLAALRSRFKTEAEVEAAYRENYARWVEEHDRTVVHMFTELNRRAHPRSFGLRVSAAIQPRDTGPGILDEMGRCVAAFY